MVQEPYNQNVLFTMQSILAQYPILSDQILSSLYDRLIQDGFVTYNSLEEKVREYALLSQKREGLQNPFAQEAQHVWEKRLRRVRSQMISQEFSRHYTIGEFEKIVDDTIQDKSDVKPATVMWHNLQHASVETIFEQALAIEHMPSAERKNFEAQLMGAKVALIQKIISDRLGYIAMAKNVFSIHDLIEINQMRIGRGPVGGKSAGILLADRILQDSADADIRNSISKTKSFFIGADEFYSFLSINNLLSWYDQKYKDAEAIREEFPVLVEKFQEGQFSQDMSSSLKRVLADIDGNPYIVRSSSLLEDDFNCPFNGMYESVFLSNQGNPEENLQELQDAIRKIYISTFNPNAMEYRRKNGLLDYAEKMAVLIQVVPGASFGGFYFTDISGYAASVSAHKWKHDIAEKDEGMLRFTLGLGTHATHRSGRDFAHIVVLSDPETRHTSFVRGEQLISQQLTDVFNMRANHSETRDIQDVVNESYPPFFWIAQNIEDGRASNLQRGNDTDNAQITFNDLVQKTNFTRLMRDILHQLSAVYGRPVLIEFSAAIDMEIPGEPSFHIQIHKCRPTCIPENITGLYMKPSIPVKRELLASDLFIENGLLENITQVVFIDPDRFRKFSMPEKQEFCSLLSSLNRSLANERFVFAAASRFGCSSNNGIPVIYSEISNALALIELSGWSPEYVSDPFIGTQFYQSITEAGMYSIITDADQPEHIDHSFFTDSPDTTDKWLDVPEKYKGAVRVLSTEGWYGSKSLMIEMDREAGVTKANFV